MASSIADQHRDRPAAFAFGCSRVPYRPKINTLLEAGGHAAARAATAPGLRARTYY